VKQLRNVALRGRLAAGFAALAVLFLTCVGVAAYYLNEGAGLAAQRAEVQKTLPEGPSGARLKAIVETTALAGEVGLRAVLLTAATALVLGIPLGIYLWGSATRPLRRLAEVLSRAERGELGRADTDGRDEVAELSRALVSALETQRTFEALRQERLVILRNRLRVLLAALPSGVLVLDEEGMIVEANQAALDLTGAAGLEKTLVSQAPIPAPLGEALLAQIHEGGAGSETELSWEIESRTVRVRFSLHPVRNAEDRLRGWVALFTASSTNR
jgi:PAS domain-containing protein